MRALLQTGLALALVVTAACGDDDDGGQATSAGSTRTITHAMGTTEVPEDPERVVVLDTPQLDAMVAVGVAPVGATRTDVSPDLPAWLGDVGDVPAVGTIHSPNLEAIAARDPDLILSSKTRHEELYDELSAIAPTVFAEGVADGWKQNFVLFADAAGHGAEAEAMLSDYEERARHLGSRLSPGGEPATTGIVRFLPDEIRIYGPESFSGSVLLDLDVNLPGAVADLSGDIALYPSIEEIGLVSDADVLFVTTYGDPAATTAGSVRNSGLWKALPAVKANRAHEVSDDIWMLGIGVVGANAILDDVERFLD